MRNKAALAIAGIVLAAGSATALPAQAATAISSKAAAEAEWNNGVAGTPPSGMPCISMTGANVCFERYGDKFWVHDTKGDGASALVAWKSQPGGYGAPAVRYGFCVNSLGNTTWAVCNKDLSESGVISLQPATVDGSAGGPFQSSGQTLIIPANL